MRQTVLTGTVDSSGFPNALAAASGLSISLSASSSSPFVIAFAAGFDGNGAIDYVGQFTGNQTLGGLTANTTCYVFAERTSPANLGLGFSTLAPSYDRVAPSSPSTGQHWFDLSSFVMKQWNGSSWDVVQRVFVGEVVTGASTVTSATTYAHQRRYRSIWTAVSGGTGYTFNHNLGIPLPAAEAAIEIYAGTTSGDTTATECPKFYQASSINVGWLPRLALVSNTRVAFGLLTATNPLLDSSGNPVTSGYYKLTIRGGW